MVLLRGACSCFQLFVLIFGLNILNEPKDTIVLHCEENKILGKNPDC